MAKKPTISHFGECGILLQWDFDFSPENLKVLLSAKAKIEQLLENSEVEVINTYTALLVIYPVAAITRFSDFKRLQEMDFSNLQNIVIAQRLIEIPVCYDTYFGLDLEFLAKEKNRSIAAIVEMHTEPIYTVYFIGFLPGFPYLGGLDERLAFPRKKEPRSKIEKGAVGIAENQTGIYPQASPAGWQIIGNCPLTLFNPVAATPCLLKAGDQIQFKAVDKEEYEAIKAAVTAGNYQFQIRTENG
jgi:inhibitor of KinA